MNKKIAISVKNLVKEYKKARKNAVDDISFEVQEGEFFAFLGPNGAGKTTTISILTTILSKTSGTLNVAGFDIDTDEQKIRKNVGIIFQNPSLDLNLTAETNIRMHAFMWGLYAFKPSYSMMPEEYKKRVEELADILGIGEDLFKPLKTFSGGMKRKLEIVRSLMHDPKILFLDEPTTGLDPLSRKNLWEYLEKMRKDLGTTIFLTTHYLDEAENVDHLCVIDEGKIVFDGTPTRLKNKLLNYQLNFTLAHKPTDHIISLLKKYELELNSTGKYLIETKTASEAQEIITKINVPLLELNLLHPSLEEAYLKLIEKNP